MPDKETPPEKPLLDRWIPRLKDIVALLRDLSVFSLALLLLAFPTKLNTILINAGFEEGSIVGFKWKRGFVDLNNQLQTANQTITALREQNGKLSKALSAATETNNANAEKIAKLQTQNQQVSKIATQVQNSVNQTLENNAPLVSKAQESTGRSYPNRAYCYQENRLQSGPGQYLAICFEEKESCEKTRGPNELYKQTQCKLTDLTAATWNPGHPGWMGSWYQYSSKPFGKPFPQL